MMIYRIRWDDPYEGNCIEWASTQSDVADAKRQITKEWKESITYPARPTFEVSKVRIPTESARGLAGWLNIHLVRDNG